MATNMRHGSPLERLFPGSAAAFLASYPGTPFHAAGPLSRLPPFAGELSLGWLSEHYTDRLDLHADDSRPVSIDAAGPEAVLWLLERCGGITFERIERFVPGLQAWCAELAAELALPPHATRPRCNAFASPRSSGYQFHFHYEGALLVQLDGHKSARLAPVRGGPPVVQADLNQRFEEGFGSEPRPMAVHAQFAATGFPAPPGEQETEVYELSPGSVLYIPPGYWHATRCLSERSFAFSIFIATPRLYEVFLRALELALLADPAWREPVASRSITDRASSWTRLDAMRAQFGRVAAGLRPEDLLLCLGQSPPLSEQSTLCPNPDVRWSLEPAHGGAARLRLRSDHDYEVEVESDLAAVLRSLLERTIPFTMEAARRSMPADLTQDLADAVELLESVGGLVRGPFPARAETATPGSQPGDSATQSSRPALAKWGIARTDD